MNILQNRWEIVCNIRTTLHWAFGTLKTLQVFENLQGLYNRKSSIGKIVNFSNPFLPIPHHFLMAPLFDFWRIHCTHKNIYKMLVS